MGEKEAGSWLHSILRVVKNPIIRVQNSQIWPGKKTHSPPSCLPLPPICGNVATAYDPVSGLFPGTVVTGACLVLGSQRRTLISLLCLLDFASDCLWAEVPKFIVIL